MVGVCAFWGLWEVEEVVVVVVVDDEVLWLRVCFGFVSLCVYVCGVGGLGWIDGWREGRGELLVSFSV